MNSKTGKTAILYFSRSANEEARTKTFYSAGSFKQNKAIAQKLISHTYNQLKKTAYPVKIFNSERQTGHSFGEKFAHAFEALFQEGYEQVIAVGNDCLELSADTVEQAASRLTERQVVAGPATDGGAYLMGLHRDAFDKEAFTSLAWETDKLLADFINYARAQTATISFLKELGDIDHESTLRQSLYQICLLKNNLRLVIILLGILNSLAGRQILQKTGFRAFYIRRTHRHRAPPLLK